MSARDSAGRTPTAADLDRARRALADVGRRARATNISRAKEIEEVLMAAVAGEALTQERLRSAERAAHRIAGSAGTIGMHQVSELARDLEAGIAGGSVADPAALLHAVTVLKEIQRQLEDESAGGLEPTEPTIEGRHEILVVTADDNLADRIGAAAEKQGWTSRWAAELPAAHAALTRGAPDVVILDATLHQAGAAALVADAATERPRCPTIVIGPEGDAARVEAARAGADRFVSTSRSPEAVVAVAIDAAGLPRWAPARILVLAQPATLDAIEDVLPGPALDVASVSTEGALRTALDTAPPDLLVIATEVPGALDLCRTLRDEARWAPLPVLVLLDDRGADSVRAAFDAGADDVVPAPFIGTELVARVTGRLDRARLRRQVRETDPATGLANRPSVEAAFSRLAARGSRTGSPVSVALIDMDGLRVLNGEYGYGLGDAVLGRMAALLESSFRDGDLVGRWGGEEFLVAMSGLRRADGVARVAAVLESFRNHAFVASTGASVFVTFSAAVAEHPTDGNDLPALVRTLNRVLVSAKRAGGNRVLPVGWQPRAVRNTTDVFIVEDDEMLAGLLQQALDTRGLRSEHEVDGKVALDRLIGPNRLSARVILLDVDLPGMNGLDVLRRLESEGVLAHSHVIMLTAYAGEQDVVTAMRHGAFDHVAKPFSLPVLTQRLRRALDSGPTP
jgi:diguanylate cyclase (GGDEF)-like protein